AYSPPKTVYGKVIQAWQQTADGKGVSFTQSYAASTDQARAVAAGLKADLVFLSTGDDVNVLVDAGLVDKNWEKQSYHGIEADTVVVFAVRNGNPKHIKSWGDLVKPGVQVITPNPFSSGSAKWNILAAYGAQRRLGQDLFGQYGWRPVNPTVAKKYASKYPARPGIFRIDDKMFGGWRTVDKKWFSANGIMVGIERGIGGPTSG